MTFARARSAAAALHLLERTPSTNDELVSLIAADGAGAGVPEFTTIATLNQTNGRGRLGRAWVAPAGQALAASVLLVPAGRVPHERLGWVPLMAGLAMARAVRSVLPATVQLDGAGEPRRVSVKWPNDVYISGRKVSGILTELLPGAAGVVVGAGLNLTIPAESLPVPTATSLLLEGADGDADMADAALASFLIELRTLWGAYCTAGGDALACGIHDAVSEECGTLGQTVRVTMPGGESGAGGALAGSDLVGSDLAGSDLVGRAVALDSDGQLVICAAADAALVTVAAGDITHLRYE